MEKIYLNPNWNPKIYLNYVKYLLVIYDKIILWSPREADLHTYINESRQFVDHILLNKKENLVITAGRSEWYHKKESKNENAYKKYLLEIAESNNTILSSQDKESGYNLLDSKWTDESYQKAISQRMQSIKDKFDHSMIEKIEEVGEAMKKPIEWALANAYIQDVIAMNSLGCDVIPFQSCELASGYQILNLFSKNERNDISTSCINPNFNLFKNEDKLRELEEVVKYLNQVENMSWMDIIDFRKRYGKNIRRWVSYLRQQNTMTLKENAIREFEKYENESDKFVKAVLGSVPGSKNIGEAVSLLLAKRVKALITSPVLWKYSKSRYTGFLFDTPAWKNRTDN